MPPAADVEGLFRQLQEEDIDGAYSWSTGILVFCGVCCAMAAFGKWKFEHDGARSCHSLALVNID